MLAWTARAMVPTAKPASMLNQRPTHLHPLHCIVQGRARCNGTCPLQFSMHNLTLAGLCGRRYVFAAKPLTKALPGPTSPVPRLVPRRTRRHMHCLTSSSPMTPR